MTWEAPRVLFGIAVSLQLFAVGAVSESNDKGQTSIPVCTDLRNDSARQRRWLSLPDSRIVINPDNSWGRRTESECSNGPDLPLNTGYYAYNNTYRQSGLLSVMKYSPDAYPKMNVGFEDGFDTGPLTWEMQPNMKAETRDGSLQMQVTHPNSGGTECGYVWKKVRVDLDKYPYVEICVKEAVGSWALKVAPGPVAADIPLEMDTLKAGVFTYDLRRLTGWSGGKKEFCVNLYSMGTNAPVKVDFIRLVGIEKPARSSAEEFKTAWQPDALPFSADYATSLSLEGEDFLFDPTAIVRTLHLRGRDQSELNLSLGGKPVGELTWNDAEKTLCDTCTSYVTAIAFSEPDAVHGFKRYASLAECMANAPSSGTGEMSSMWAVDLVTSGPEANLAVGIGFATANEGSSVTAIRRAKASISNSAWVARREERQKQWNAFLKSVPRPASFEHGAVPDFGVKAHDVWHAYYDAWVFTAATILPVMPETDFQYPQFSVGKPSMWTDGHPKASPTASWESLFAMQFYSRIDPRISEAAFRGLLSLVDEKGYLGGESLPSRKAETAMVIYSRSGDKQFLRDVYPAIKRYLLWRRDNPRWIFKGNSFPSQRDSDFVVSAIKDMEYMRRIADELGDEAEAELWLRESRQLFSNYLNWFWAKPTSTPVEFYDVVTRKRSSGESLWVATGLCLKQLSDSRYVDGLMRRLDQHYDKSKPFDGLEMPKYPEMQQVVYGLLDRGMRRRAERLCSVAIRDVVRSGDFAELYLVNGVDTPEPDGVRPSYFGAGMLIDFVWLKNGVRLKDQGY